MFVSRCQSKGIYQLHRSRPAYDDRFDIWFASMDFPVNLSPAQAEALGLPALDYGDGPIPVDVHVRPLQPVA